jgi:chaperonin GroEL
MEDIAVLTGTRVIMNNMQESVKKVRLEDLGRARGVTVNKDYFGLIGGHGDPKALRERIATVREQLKRQEKVETDETKQLRERLGKLVGGVGIIYVNEATPAATIARKEVVERTVNTVKRAELGGIVPGGGMAYIACIPALRRLKLPREQAVGLDALARALEEPLRAIARNSGKDEGPIAALALQQRPGWGYNASSDRFEDLWAAGVVDPFPVARAALQNAVSGALMALTTSVTVHRKNPPTSTEP